MKTKILFLLATLIAMAQGAWAQTTVTTDSELRNAIKDGASIKLGNDIDLSNSTLSIASGTKVTIDLGGFSLDRKLTKRGEGGGQVITVREGATLNLSNGTLKGGWGGNAGGIANEAGTANLTDVTITGCSGDDKGGAICNLSGGTLTMKGGSITGNTSFDKDDPTGGGGLFNAEGATATLTDVTITGNQAKSKGGGGICNYGTLTLDGCTITGNTCGKNGGGIYNYSTATLNMQGKNTITDNKGLGSVTHNVFLKENAVITVTGALTDSKISITLEAKTGTFTSGYNIYNSGVEPATIFTPDLSVVMAVSLDTNNEAQLLSTVPEGSVYYVDREWDDVNLCVTEEIKFVEATELSSILRYDVEDYDAPSLKGGWYKVSSDYTFVKSDASTNYDRRVVCKGDVRLIICDGVTLNVDNLTVEGDDTLHIYGQAYDSGKLNADAYARGYDDGLPAIGCRNAEGKDGGRIFIHGGDIYARSAEGGAGIGGGFLGVFDPGYTAPKSITIYGGKVEARGVSDEPRKTGAGIGGGGGKHCVDGITIYGGDISAYGGDDAAGIGGGESSDGGNITIWGGNILASADGNGPGIGGENGGNVIINGGEILASSGFDGAGIGGAEGGNGGKITINGGKVYAYGYSYKDEYDHSRYKFHGAAIGGGDGGNGGKITINGGEVYAYCGTDAAGIGGGEGGNSGTIVITGGKVYAYGNVQESNYGAGIGGGQDGDAETIEISGGEIYAYGGEDAAGIGGGEGGDVKYIHINGGYIEAKGKGYGSGIGGGEDGDIDGQIIITGGTVIAKAGLNETGCRAIGPGNGSDNYGSLTIGDEMMVSSERMANAVERKNMCWYRTQVRVEPCDHHDHTYIWSGTTAKDTHTEQCQYCTTAFEPEHHTFVDKVCTVCGTQETFGTGVEEVRSVEVKSEKWADAWYSLDGRRLSGKPSRAGVYIYNGKMCVIK